MSKEAALLAGNLFGSLFGGLSGLFSNQAAISSQKEIQDSVNHHNMKLAQMQNQWNLAQWQRENAYNSPAAQMDRFKAAGLNPNLIYGQTNTAPQLSGSLTSGAPAQAPDLSGLFSERSNMLQSMFSKLGESMMQIPLYKEQVRGAKLDNERKETQLDKENLEYSTFARFFGVGSSNWSDLMNDEEEFNAITDSMNAPVRQKFDEMREQYFRTRDVQEQWRERVIKNSISNSTYESVIKQIMREAQITELNARYLFDTYTERVSGCKAENMILQIEADWMTVEKYMEMGSAAMNIIVNGYNTVYGRKFGIKNFPPVHNTYNTVYNNGRK